MDCSRSLCTSCTKNCSSTLISELAMRGCVSNIYLRNGRKIAYACKLYSARKSPAHALKEMVSASSVINNTYQNNPGLGKPGFMLPDLKVV